MAHELALINSSEDKGELKGITNAQSGLAARLCVLKVATPDKFLIGTQVHTVEVDEKGRAIVDEDLPLNKFVFQVAITESEAIQTKMQSMHKTFIDATIHYFDEYAATGFNKEGGDHLLEREVFIEMINEGLFQATPSIVVDASIGI